LAYARETISNVQHLTTKNEQLENNLQTARQQAEQFREIVKNAVSALEEMRTTILVEV